MGRPRLPTLRGMAQAPFLTSGSLRRWLGRAPAAPAPDVNSGSSFSTGLGHSTDWELAAADSLVGDAVRFAQERRRVAEEVAIELVQRRDLREAPEPVQDFLLQSWALVLAHVRLAGGADEAQGYAAVVPQLLWSVRRESTLRRPARLVGLVPGLLQRLREGLQLLGREPREFQAFFSELERLHRPALQLCATRRQLQLQLQDAESVAPPPGWADRLAPGAGLDLYLHRAWVRFRLDWADPHGHQFMFRGPLGEARSMTRRILLRLVGEGLARPARAD